MTDAHKHEIGGLLQRRAKLQTKTATLRERMAVIGTDIEAIDRVLDSMGYQGEPENRKARTERVVLFYRNELRSFLMKELLASKRPLSTRELALRICGAGRPGDARQATSDRRGEADEQSAADDAAWEAGSGVAL